MLKNSYKLWLPLVILCIMIGMILSGLGYCFRNNDSYLKNNQHQWYQIIYIDSDDNLHVGVEFQDISIGGFEIPLP